MLVTFTSEEISTFSASTRGELMAAVFAKPKADTSSLPEGFNDYDFEDVVDLSQEQVNEFMDGCSAETVAGLRVVAEHGPIIHATLLDAAGIENYGHFQGRVTKRARTVTRNKKAFLFTWDNWQKQPNGVGHYVVSQVTHKSLRRYFGLD